MKKEDIEKLMRTPGSATISSREKVKPETCKHLTDACHARDIRYLFLIGGNDTAENARLIADYAKDDEIIVRHIPKTIDCDILGNDHTPGYPSAGTLSALSPRV